MPLQNRGLFTYPDDMYNPETLEFLDRTSLQKEYNRLRKEANRRLAQFDGTEWTETKIYKSNAGKYDQNINKMTASELRYALTDVHDYLRMKLSTVRGMQIQRAKAVRRLNALGYKKITKKNFLAFTNFIDEIRERKIDKTVSSNELVEFFDSQKVIETDREKLIEKFEDWQKGKDNENINSDTNTGSTGRTGAKKNSHGQKGKQGRRKKGKNS